MVEMDLIFGHFARRKLSTLDAELLDEYDMLLKQLDSDLFRWLIVGEKAPDDVENSKCYHALKDFIANERTELLGNY
ncbi:hypothetical protein AGDE_03906 [Angomonas deanei]|uniref:Flavinator of succinate dehydrogenase, putative n=1 Tax=Angomonas deanei TaxID=59799 RepID=A0A7G2C3I8_9TRYP|nr:hypothetical protein AGDE_03906 [Angomonas deanei]CAD2214276.1 Flavinator of succinate dehydrogenase, putative [Angomonas deanei]|eukprot:EPY40022.1 hypothetical protein AGDE_03906 [Angomonas deanei]